MDGHLNGHDTLRIGFIGASNIAVKHAIALSRIPGVQLVAVCDINDERRKAFVERFPVADYADARQMLEKESLQVVTVMTPSGNHADMTCLVAGYGCHVIVEKPMALKLEDADRQIESCRQHGVRLFTVMQNRFSQPVLALRRALEENRFGKLVMATARVRWHRSQEYYDEAKWRGTWNRDGGVFSNQACHHIDMLRWLMGDVESVVAEKASRLANIEAEDTGAAIFRFANGGLGVLEATTAWRPKDMEGTIALAGEGGSVEIGGFIMDKLRHWSFAVEREEDQTIWQTHGESPKIIAWTHERYLRDVFDALRQGRPAMVEGEEGRKTVELLNAIYEASETGSEVRLRFRPKHSKLGRD
ncbi:MAG: Gfo/Idh/MocA family oxidoreductase [Magnetococcales bacterium]|nr:Gfo/Idh/MocA family oxidoreductase [Magnetococcales bacterium]NGZ25662.1 Gfo/Idh/MocA family oxidoreductase [Magnetococcales bacterium]